MARSRHAEASARENVRRRFGAVRGSPGFGVKPECGAHGRLARGGWKKWHWRSLPRPAGERGPCLPGTGGQLLLLSNHLKPWRGFVLFGLVRAEPALSPGNRRGNPPDAPGDLSDRRCKWDARRADRPARRAVRHTANAAGAGQAGPPVPAFARLPFCQLHFWLTGVHAGRDDFLASV